MLLLYQTLRKLIFDLLIKCQELDVKKTFPVT